MSRPALAQFDWPGWRADVFERLDRRSIVAASAFTAAWMAMEVVADIISGGDHGAFALTVYALSNFVIVMVTLAVLAAALVAVARGVSVWVAYPAAGFAAFAIGWIISEVTNPFCGCAPRGLSGHLWVLSFLCPPAVLYVYASSAAHDAKVLRALEAERTAEAERLARQRLQTELAMVDHDLVLRALRLALTMPASEAGQAETLLEAVTAYLRVAQQRGSSEPERVAAALRRLKEACASGSGQPAHV